VLGRSATAIIAAAFLCIGCGHQAAMLPTPPDQSQKSHASIASARSGNSALVADHFAKARGMTLSDADIDTFIDPSVSGSDRRTAHELLAFMPPNQRGDFVYVAPGNRLVSNNPSLLQHVTLTVSPSGTTASARAPASVRTIHDYSSSCSPPNPPSHAGGPYVRLVSKCGFVAAWGFVTIPPGTSYMPTSSDQGYAYFEIRGANGGLIEGGLNYYNDGDIAPYMRSSSAASPGYVSLTNGSNRYSAGEDLAIWAGVTSTAAYVFTEIGALPYGLDPATTYLTNTQISLDNAAWTFYPTPAYFTQGGGGTDAAGASTPCVNCSVSKVTSIGQGGVSSWTDDGAYFGIDSNYDNAIAWRQVLFGDWASNCAPGTSLCTMYISSNPFTYYGGPQYYPNQDVSDSSMAPAGYGPYETYDGIDTGGDSGSSKLRAPAGTFTEPLPPLPTPTPAATPTPRPIKCPTGCVCNNAAPVQNEMVTPNIACPQLRTTETGRSTSLSTAGMRP
jgi:hypothetical protein